MDVRGRLVALAGTADARSLAEGALWIAAEAYPGLDVPHWLGRLEMLGRRAAERVTPEMPVEAAASVVSRVLFEEVGLRGNTEDYYDPRNSFLNDVLERQIGIPISLSVVYLAVAAAGRARRRRRRPAGALRRARGAGRAPAASSTPSTGDGCSTRPNARRSSPGCDPAAGRSIPGGSSP